MYMSSFIRVKSDDFVFFLLSQAVDSTCIQNKTALWCGIDVTGSDVSVGLPPLHVYLHQTAYSGLSSRLSDQSTM